MLRLKQSQPHCIRGFTLVEILIVVMILGILAAIIIPQYTDSKRETSQTAFITDIRTYGNAAQVYRSRTGQFLEDSSSGQVPSGWESYIDDKAWVRATPIGGVWDAELNQFGIVSGIGVHFMDAAEKKDDAFMLEIDRKFDDGDLNTGGFRKIAADRYYLILAE
ncbi:MAG: type II secretion system protein [Phycisphaerae bacterium]